MPQWGEKGERDQKGGEEGEGKGIREESQGKRATVKKKQNRRGQETRVKEQGSNRREQVSPPLNKFGAPL